ncbi:hypothetical protein OH687_22570 [Burkholderia anthina]|nr:hypothetical protein OH687_22570 [Burkholderia anthina]
MRGRPIAERACRRGAVVQPAADASAVASKLDGRGPAEAPPVPILGGDAEPVYYPKITLRTARFAERRNPTVARSIRIPARRATWHVGPRVSGEE